MTAARLVVETAEEPCPEEWLDIAAGFALDEHGSVIDHTITGHPLNCPRKCGGSGSVLKPWVVTPQDALTVPCESAYPDGTCDCWRHDTRSDGRASAEPGSTYRDVELVRDRSAGTTICIDSLGVVATVYVIEKANVAWDGIDRGIWWGDVMTGTHKGERGLAVPRPIFDAVQAVPGDTVCVATELERT